MNTQAQTTLFHETDYLCCNLVSHGRQLMQLTISGVKTLADVFRVLMSRLEGIKGMVTVNLRNITQGWSNRYPLCVR